MVLACLPIALFPSNRSFLENLLISWRMRTAFCLHWLCRSFSDTNFKIRVVTYRADMNFIYKKEVKLKHQKTEQVCSSQDVNRHSDWAPLQTRPVTLLAECSRRKIICGKYIFSSKAGILGHPALLQKCFTLVQIIIDLTIRSTGHGALATQCSASCSKRKFQITGWSKLFSSAQEHTILTADASVTVLHFTSCVLPERRELGCSDVMFSTG